MTIKGTVVGIIYVNEENGYSVLEFEAGNRYFTAVGIFPIVEQGELLSLTGEFKQNPKFGEQFAVESVEFIKPDDIDSIKKYLASGLFKGIGEKLAQQIVDKFGTNTMDIIESTPQALKKVSGIGKVKLAGIVESYQANKDMKESIFFLQRQDITMNLALKIYRFYGDATISAIKNNPYILVKDIDGVGFFTADKIAMKLGVEKDSAFRIQAAIYHTLSEAAVRGGHTCLPDNILISQTAKLLKYDDMDAISQCLESMENIKTVQVDDVNMVATSMNFHTEKAIATRLMSLDTTAEKWNFDIAKEFEYYQRTSGLALHTLQKHAIKSVFENGVSVITGGPGTGKTTIIKGITSILTNHNLNVVLCAPTGRASKRMAQATGMEAKTIHRLLGIEFGGKGDNFVHNETNPLEIDALIVDEISMADIYIFHALLKSIPLGARLILVGDKDQLPSVSCGNILADIIACELINVVYLTEIYRQSKESAIVTNAHRINAGHIPQAQGASDFFIDGQNDSLGILNAVNSMTKSRIPRYLGINSGDIQVLAPLKKGLVGVENLNLELQKTLNPTGQGIKYKDTKFLVGDKVMQTVNNYSAEWIKRENFESGKGVFNGDIGYVVVAYDDTVKVEFEDGKIVTYKAGSLDELVLAYCISVHKSQGSEFDVVIMVVSSGSYMLLTRNLLYTAVTRAKKMVVLIGSDENIGKMVSNTYTAKRHSLLRHFIRSEKTKVDLLWGID